MKGGVDVMNKICSMCGREQSVDNFRKYKSGKPYTYCKDCEAIEIRRRYLEHKGAGCSSDEADELVRINHLYQMRVNSGLNTFGTRKRSSSTCMDLVNEQLKSLG